MNKYVYPLDIWTYLPFSIKFTRKVVLVQFTNGTFYLLFKQPNAPLLSHEEEGWNVEEDFDWDLHHKLQAVENEHLEEFKRDFELRQKFNGSFSFNLKS